ncbi:MAG TPA: ABC transporter substrate-binding protein [Acidobacteriaceae bacterium]|nr:ABC transporter substrate-binding protein [Acidobacteriaceae bacterium]
MKIASLQPSVSIVLDRLGCLDAPGAPDAPVSLVACTRYCLEAVPALRTRPVAVVRDSWSTSADELLAVRPDLVIASVPYRRESLEAILKAGCPVLALAPHSLADIEQDIRLIAAVAGAPSRAEPVIAAMRNAIAEIRRRSAPLAPRPRVYCEEWGKPPIHSQLWVRELVEAAGGVFVGQPGATTTLQAVAAADPDVVIASWCGAGDRVPLEKIAARPGWERMRAVREGRVCCIADELLNTPAPTLVGGLEALAAALHPDHFPAPGGLRWLAPNPSTVQCV